MADQHILLTGANGFLGRYLKSSLLRSGALETLARSRATYNVDLASAMPPLGGSYDLVVHSAGKAHVVPTDAIEAQKFFNVNVRGTQNLLKALELTAVRPKAFVFISSVSVYGLELGTNIPETHQLNATDPYGKSKIQAEELVAAWCKENQVICTILRLPLIVGKDAPGNLGSMINSIRKGYYFNIAGGTARKSMVLAQDVADIIVTASSVGGIFNLTDGFHPNFNELSAEIAKKLNKSTPSLNLPLGLAKLLGKIGDLLGERAPVNSRKMQKITSDLTFNDDHARRTINWNPTPVLRGLEI